MPVVTSSRSFGSAWMQLGIETRALAHGDDDVEIGERGDRSARSKMWSLKTAMSTSEASGLQSASRQGNILVVVENGAAMHGVSFVCRRWRL